MADEGTAKLERRVLFVRNVPFDATDAQLEEAFVALGPVRRCFLVRQKGAENHRGFGYVHFALAEDATRAVNAPQGIHLKGRKLQLHVAGKRPPKEERIKARIIQDEDAGAQKEEPEQADAATAEKVNTATAKTKAVAGAPKPDVDVDAVAEVGKKRPRAPSEAEPGIQGNGNESHKKKKKDRKEGEASPAQRSARTVVLGGIHDQAMKESALAAMRETVTLAETPCDLSGDELKLHCLARDGCSPDALAIVCSSVRDARKAVAELHRKKLGGGTLWARQLGGEGSKLKKHRLIVRNLPYQVNEAELWTAFGAAGFIWDLTLPRMPGGRLRGFAFIQYTSHADAEKAVTSLNGTLIGGRPVAVDWTVPKAEYVTAATSKSEECEPVSGASEKDAEDEGDREGEGEGEGEGDRDGNHSTDAADFLDKDRTEATEGIGAGSTHGELDESEQVQRVLAKVLGEAADSSKRKITPGKQPPVQDDQTEDGLKDDTKAKVKHKSLDKAKVDPPKAGCCTIFVRGLPSSAQESDVRDVFSKFGNLRSCRLVLHPVTRRPQGTAFIDFAKAPEAEAAVKKAGKGASIVVHGRKLSVNLAVGREEAKQIAVEKAAKAGKAAKEQKRHLHLLEEGIIKEGSTAAQGLSDFDRRKRSRLQEEKATKLRSPRFGVSPVRLAVHNVPDKMTSAQLRHLFLDAVRQRATKQNPTITEVKILVDKTKKVKGSPAPQRGVAFVEFSDPQHALAALRAVNNHPDLFKPDRRPVVEFAIVDHGLKNRQGFQGKELPNKAEGNSDGGAAKSKKRKRQESY